MHVKSFEMIDFYLLILSANFTVQILVIILSTTSFLRKSPNHFTISLNEFSVLLEQLVVCSGKLLIIRINQTGFTHYKNVKVN